TLAELNGDFTQLGPNGTPLSFYHNIYNPYSTRPTGAAPNTTFLRDRFFCDSNGNGNPLPLLPGQNVQVTPNPSGATPTPAGAGFCNKIPQALIFTPMQQFFQKYGPTPNISGNIFAPPNAQQVNFIRTRPGLNT